MLLVLVQVSDVLGSINLQNPGCVLVEYYIQPLRASNILDRTIQ